MSVEQQEKRAKIDEGLYSRQLYVMGHEAQIKITTSKVLIIGVGLLGVEVAKNIILAGVKQVILHDTSIVTQKDVEENYYITKEDISKTRAEACIRKLSELNGYVDVSILPKKIDSSDKETLSSFTCVCITDLPVYASQTWLGTLNDTCHELNVKFISSKIAGLFCYAFCDFGEEFTILDKDGENPVHCLLSGVMLQKKGDKTLLEVTVHDETRHGLVTGDSVKFTELSGDLAKLNEQLFKIKETGPYTFEIICDVPVSAAYEGGGNITEVKQPVKMNFKPLNKILEPTMDELLMTDFSKMNRPKVLHALFLAVQKYSETHAGTVPCETEYNASQLEDLFEIYKTFYTTQDEVSDMEQRKLVYSFGMGYRAELAPIASFLGGVVGQEVLKACSQKFTPLKQFLYFDAVECLPFWKEDGEKDEWDEFVTNIKGTSGNGTTSESIVFGKEFTNQLGMLNMFLVGAGAIGCEMLKNWALMGVGCGTEGKITITDMDIIERSNLNRQFLFRDIDVGSSKAHAAAKAARVMNSKINITPMEDKVGSETENVFTEDFMQSLDIVTTALDNMKARLYVDSRCLMFQKPLLESGTLGTKGNTQVVVPHLTENYGASRDPPEKEIAICTLKNFPYRIEHTLQWARDLFEGEFDSNVDTVNKFLKAENVKDVFNSSQFATMNDNVKITSLQMVMKSLTIENCKTMQECVAWARNSFEKLFTNQIKQLLHNFPPGTVTSSGALFWSGTKREPVALNFSPDDPTHMNFVASAANLRAFAFNIPQNTNIDEVKLMVEKVEVEAFVPKSVKIAVSDKELKEQEKENDELADLDTVLDNLLSDISSITSEVKTKVSLSVSEFEKDDDSNFHMDFITAASNLRARNYMIEEVNKHKAKLIAGKIIPAIATTTALVTGLICLELYKLVAGKKKVESYKNGFVNLALPLFAFSEPIGVEKVKAGTFEWSIWDKLEVDARVKEMTLAEFVKHFEEKYSVEINMITYGSLVLYSSFLSGAKRKERLPMTMKAVTELIAKQKFGPEIKSLQYELCCTDEEDEDVDLPPIYYKIG